MTDLQTTSINGVVVTWVVAISRVTLDPPGVRFPLNASFTLSLWTPTENGSARSSRTLIYFDLIFRAEVLDPERISLKFSL